MFKWYSIAPRILQTVTWLPTRLIFNFFGRFEIQGKENLKGLKQVIFAMNHVGEVDPIVLTSVLSPFGPFIPLFYVSVSGKYIKERHTQLGWRRYLYTDMFLNAWGAYTVYLGLKDYGQALKHHIGILNDGYSDVIWPEGKFTDDGTIREGHGGVSYLAHKSQVTVIPVAIDGVFKMSAKMFFLRKRKIFLNFGKPIAPISDPNKEVSVIEYKEYSQKIVNELARLKNQSQT